jgi:hypothetical protein
LSNSLAYTILAEVAELATSVASTGCHPARSPMNSVTLEVSVIQKDLKLLMEQEDVKWKQRAKINWLNFGDKNTVLSCVCKPKAEDQ